MDKMPFRISAKWQLRLFLLFAPGLLAEILSGNTPIFKLFNPIDLFFLVLAYGVPVMLIWEYRVQKNLSLFSVFLLGLGYGLVNEGLLAKTILDTSVVPMGGFVDTSDYLGMNWSWFFMIIPWHAFFSVSFPITLATALFPEEKNESLSGRKMRFVYLLLTFILLPLMAISWQGRIPPGIYIFLYSAIVFLVLLVRNSYFQRVMTTRDFHGLRWGLGILCLSLFQFIGAGKIPLSLYIIVSLILISLFVSKFLQMDIKNQSKFALGGYLSFGSFSTIVTLFAGRIDLLVMFIILNGGIYISLKKRGYF